MEKKKVYGIRNCVVCKGICHENAYRTRYGQRKRYFCSETCLKKYIEEGIKKHIPDKRIAEEYKLTDRDFKEFLKYYEKVDVITS